MKFILAKSKDFSIIRLDKQCLIDSIDSKLSTKYYSTIKRRTPTITNKIKNPNSQT